MTATGPSVRLCHKQLIIQCMHVAITTIWFFPLSCLLIILSLRGIITLKCFFLPALSCLHNTVLSEVIYISSVASIKSSYPKIVTELVHLPEATNGEASGLRTVFLFLKCRTIRSASLSAVKFKFYCIRITYYWFQTVYCLDFSVM